MNLGLGNLAVLKGFVLPEAQAATTDYDARLQAIGKGFAAHLENWCNRKFGYVANDTFTCTANRSYVALPRYPLITVADIAERDTAQDAFTSLGPVNEVALNISEPAGIVEFGFITAPYFARLQFTYTGGFWFETLEPTDDGYPSTIPEGATPLPGDLQQAWLLGCQRIFERSRTLSLQGIKDITRAGVQLLNLDEEVQGLVAPFRRFT
ncbi:MAG: hypothetical protein P4L99_21685 [Chthoniobacter sp.]|nr:hypothetical protein [Chthoniobacter sp.]